MIVVNNLSKDDIDKGKSRSVELAFKVEVPLMVHKNIPSIPNIMIKLSEHHDATASSVNLLFLFKFITEEEEKFLKVYSGIIVPIGSLNCKVSIVENNEVIDVPHDWNLFIVISKTKIYPHSIYTLKLSQFMQKQKGVFDCGMTYLSEPGKELRVLNSLCNGNQGMFIAGKCFPGCDMCILTIDTK